jgi:hypothetical protein
MSTMLSHDPAERAVKALFRFVATLTVVGLAIAAIWWWYFPSATLNYKLSVDVEDNGVVHHGEGVIGVDFQSNGFMRIAHTPKWSIWPRGEAFAVDLGERGTMFVLLSQDRVRAVWPWSQKHASAEAGRAALNEYYGDGFQNLPPDRTGLHTLQAFIREHAAIVDIALASLPMLVRFRDINDPTTVERVDPEHLDASFGPGVRLVRATVQITDEPVTTGIEKLIPWFRTQAGHLSGQLFEDPDHPERNLTLGAFVEGLKP